MPIICDAYLDIEVPERPLGLHLNMLCMMGWKQFQAEAVVASAIHRSKNLVGLPGGCYTSVIHQGVKPLLTQKDAHTKLTKLSYVYLTFSMSPGCACLCRLACSAAAELAADRCSGASPASWKTDSRLLIKR